jgi:hypothetical protein
LSPVIRHIALSAIVPLLLWGCGGSGSSTNTTPTTTTQPADTALGTTGPTAPSAVAATAVRPDQVALTWAGSTDSSGVTGYEVWRDETKVATTTATSYYDANLTPGSTYTYKIIAFNAAGKKTPSTTVSATTPAAATPTNSNAKLTVPNTAVAGDRISVTLDPGGSTVYGHLSVYPSYQFDQAAWQPVGVPVERLDFCRNGCSAPITVDYITVPTNWPTGSYFYCVTSPGTSCARMEVTNNAPLPDQGTCSAVSLQGAADAKYDVVFLADNFSAEDIQLFRDRVEEYRTALLSVAPFSANASKFNFWKVERLGPLQSDPYDIPLNDLWAPMVSRCGAGPDMVAIIEGPSFHSSQRDTAAGAELPQWLLTRYADNGSVFVHEFGHGFAKLGDEYMNTTVFLGDPTSSARPNVDAPFCPQWCSGMPNFSATLSNGFSCWTAWENFNTCINKLSPAERNGAAVDNCWTQASDMHNGWFAGISRCDFGTGCQPGTGCFWGAGHATNLFRPTDNSIMSGAENSLGFNPPSQQAILNKLGQYR